MKVAVVNRTNLKNYGSVLQVLALCNTIKRLGYNSEVVWESGNKSRDFDIRPNKIFWTAVKMLFHPSLIKSTLSTAKYVSKVENSPEKVRMFDEFVSANFTQSFYSNSELKRVARSDEYKKFVCGSDQVWSTTTLYPDPMMYLRFAPKEKRVAYAPSMGRDYIPDYNMSVLKRYIKAIPKVSIREDDGQRLIKELTGRDVPVVADPTLLMNKDEWKRYSVDINVPQKYILCYFLSDTTKQIKSAIKEYATNHNACVLCLGNIKIEQTENISIDYPIVGPGEFLTLIERSTIVITDSYHGMLFAINYRKKLWSVEREYGEFDQSSRQKTVLERLDLSERYLDKFATHFSDDEINYDEVSVKLNKFVGYSIDYLKSALL